MTLSQSTMPSIYLVHVLVSLSFHLPEASRLSLKISLVAPTWNFPCLKNPQDVDLL